MIHKLIPRQGLTAYVHERHRNKGVAFADNQSSTLR